MTNNPGDAPPPEGPPKGLLAAVEAGKMASETVAEQPVAVDPNEIHQASSVDPNYVEPRTPDQFRLMAIGLLGDDEPAETFKADAAVLIDALINRVDLLEAALRPIANQSVQVANAAMCLRANGRSDEPAGGLWVSGVQSIHCSPNEAVFYNAADAYGRKRVEENMERAFERVRKAQEAQVDRSVHIEGGGKLH